MQELQAYEDADLAELLKDQLKLGVIERNKIIKELKARSVRDGVNNQSINKYARGGETTPAHSCMQ